MRKTLTYTVKAANRDHGKVFFLTEMSALAAEAWAARAFLAMAKSGADIPPDIRASGFAGLAMLGMQAFAGVEYHEVAPLLAEMMECVQIVPDPSNPAIVRGIFGDDDIEEVTTLLELRREVFGLHVDFSALAAAWKTLAASEGTGPEGMKTDGISFPIPMSPES